MEAAQEDPRTAKRFNPLRSFSRGVKAACRWTIGLGRGRIPLVSGRRGRRRGRRGAPPLASLSAAMLDHGDVLDLGDDTLYAAPSSRQFQPSPSAASALDIAAQVLAEAISNGNSVFPLVLRRPFLAEADSAQPWRHHHHNARPAGHCVGGDAMTCDGDSAHNSSQQLSSHQEHPEHHGGQGQGPEHSVQHLLAVGSRQWGNGGWWDGRGLLRVKIYDFAVYADAAGAAQSLCNAAANATLHDPAGPGGPASSSATAAAAAELLVHSGPRGPGGGGGVGASLTIRACRNLPLPLLSQEFERVLQRRHQKAGGAPDDPALRELLSYFSRERLPPHVVVTGGGGGGAGGGGGGGEVASLAAAAAAAGGGGDAVRKGAAITFTRSPSGHLVTEAGGSLLGVLHSPPVAAALFDLYLGDQPVSKRAKAAAGAALLRLAAAEALPPATVSSSSSSPSHLPYRYQLQPGERLLCPPGVPSWWAGAGGGGAGGGDVSACLVELP